VRHRAYTDRSHPIKLYARGFIVNPEQSYNVETDELSNRYLSWSWKRPNPGCPVVIQICFEDAESRDQLKEGADDAIDMWAQALGANAGVTFAYVGNDQVCKGDDGEWDPSVPNDVLVMRLGPESSHYNYIGWKPGKEKGRMVVEIDLDEIMSEDYYKVTIAH
jgi:hypothetical protein